MASDDHAAGALHQDVLDVTLVKTREAPRRALAIYARLWQLEIWLRQMVYVELKAAFGSGWKGGLAGTPGGSFINDFKLTHMPTPEQSPISYITFTTLARTVEANWDLFECYLPPKELWLSKLQEISQIRNRVAHFRRGHADDLDRVRRFMRDVDQGLWKFCTSYNDVRPVLPPTADPVVKRFQELNQFSYAEIGKRQWAMVGVVDPGATFSVAIDVVRRLWLTESGPRRAAGQKGNLYNITIRALDRRVIDYNRYLRDTMALHGEIIHICLDGFSDSVRITLPAVAGTRIVNKIVQGYVDWVPNALSRGRGDDETAMISHLADQWPEYVLGPENPLCFLGPDMPCSFFNA